MSEEVARAYRCPCGCGWIRDDRAHLIEYLAATGYGLSALTEPHIIATALREAADELEYGNPIGQWLCDRADEMESPNGN